MRYTYITIICVKAKIEIDYTKVRKIKMDNESTHTHITAEKQERDLNEPYKHAMFSDLQQYEEICEYAKTNPYAFWKDIAHNTLSWFEKPNIILPKYDHLETGSIEWFKDGKINACYECLDVNIKKGYGNRLAYFWEQNFPAAQGASMYTYTELHRLVNKLTNIMRAHGVKKGDRVCIYLQMIIELPVAMLACARIGAIHSVVFGGFSPQSLASRIDDLECAAVITQDTGHRGEKHNIQMKKMVDEALELSSTDVKKVFVVEYTGGLVARHDRDVFLSEQYGDPTYSKCEVMDAEDPLFVLYTSGSTGKPKGVLHTIGGYLVNAAYTHKVVYNAGPDDLQWICADIGWSTGHTYIVYAPLINRTMNLIFEGSILYPDVDRVWKIIEKYGVEIFQIAPTGLRLLLKYGDKPLEGINLDSLKLVGSVGEPIKSPEWNWLKNKIGSGRCPVIDTWWQGETGSVQLSPIPGIVDSKPGSLGYPIPGCDMSLLDSKGEEIIENNAEGSLFVKTAPPSIMRTVYNNHERFKDTYLKSNPGYFLTGDRARRDGEGMYQVLGREDDTIQVSGILVGTAEVEGAIQHVEGIAEAAVVGCEDEIKGESVIAFVVMKNDDSISHNHAMCSGIRSYVRKTIGSFAVPKFIVIVDELPKTRSGKIMRRILKDIVQKKEVCGDVSTLLNPDCVSKILETRNKSTLF